MSTVDVITLGRDVHGDYLNGIRRYPVKREVTLEGVVGKLCKTPDGWIVVMNGMRIAQPQKSIPLCLATSEEAMKRNHGVIGEALTKAYGALERARAIGVVGEDGRIIPPVDN